MEDFNRELLENYFKKNYPVNWYVWLRDAFCSFYDSNSDKMNKCGDEQMKDR